MIEFWYMLNATLLLLHEIESAYEKEWELLKLPGGISGFLMMHIPIIFLLFYGLIETVKRSDTGFVICIMTGLGGIIPFIVHKIILRRKDKFNLKMSNAVIYLNVIAGCGLVVVSLFLRK